MVGILGSLLFYAWGNLQYVPLVVGLTLLAYLVARGVTRFQGQRKSRLLLWAGFLLNVGLLIGFKLGAGDSYPLGLSFLTFQAVGYLVEVYAGKVECEKNLVGFAFFLLLFPKIPVGPITRFSQLRDSIHSIHVDAEDVADGLRRFIRGLAKKLLIADTLAKVVVPIFNLSSPAIAPWMAWLVILSYSLQLYFDFSGYTDMAIGVGRMMGFRFIENFNLPYVSKNIGDFWRRWHIALSTWFRDFVFFSLERRRLKWFGQPINILIVFTLTGLWHGLSLNFVVWGLIHGAALVFESTPAGRRLKSFAAPVQHAYALAVILTAWVFFRSPTPAFALGFLQRLLGDTKGLSPLPFELTSPLSFIEPTFIMALISAVIFCLPIGPWIEAALGKFSRSGPVFNSPVRIFSDLVLISLLLAASAAMTGSSFVPALYGRF